MMSLTRSAQIIAHIKQVDEWTQEITLGKPLPYVSLVADRVIGDSKMVLRLLKHHGYRAVDRDPSMRATRYVRPLPLWAVHWISVRVNRGFWQTLYWLCERGVLRRVNDPGTITRLRDLRPWPMKGRLA